MTPRCMHPLFLGMACVGYFYNLFTLIPILDLEGGWIAPAIAPQAWLFGLVAIGSGTDATASTWSCSAWFPSRCPGSFC